MKSEFYFQYDESGNPLYYFEFVPEFNYTLFTTSFIGTETELYFERSISYPVDCFLEKKEPCKTLFFQFLDMDSQRYIHYVNPIEHDFIASRYLKNRRIDFNLFKSERYIIKKLQTNGVFSGEEYANAVISEYLNRLGKEKFEVLMQSKLVLITKKIFFDGVFDMVSTINTLRESVFFMAKVGVYSLYILLDENRKFTCWLKQDKLI